ncbi:MAG: phage portal protein [Gemmatimonadota bacterium]|nr:phage portal protein [Gemmatimonadota bacterium]
MRWKFWERRESASQPYTDAIIQILRDNASGEDTAASARTGTEEACAGLWARAFASAKVTPENRATAALTPAVMELIGRELFERGQACFEITVQAGMVKLIPASSWYVTGADRWMYELTIAQPSAIVTRYRDADAVLHLRYGTDVTQPWTAAGPVERARTTQRLGGALERRMADEANSPAGNVIPVPSVDAKLQEDLKAIKGNNVLVPTTEDGWDKQRMDGASQGGRYDWQPRRLGANFPNTLEPTRQGASDHVAAAGGVPAALIRGDAEGTASREAWLRFMQSTIKPVARIITGELRLKLDTPDLALTFDELRAPVDIQARARTMMALTKAGMNADKAAAVAGLMMDEG